MKVCYTDYSKSMRETNFRGAEDHETLRIYNNSEISKERKKERRITSRKIQMCRYVTIPILATQIETYFKKLDTTCASNEGEDMDKKPK